MLVGSMAYILVDFTKHLIKLEMKVIQSDIITCIIKECTKLDGFNGIFH